MNYLASSNKCSGHKTKPNIALCSRGPSLASTDQRVPRRKAWQQVPTWPPTYQLNCRAALRGDRRNYSLSPPLLHLVRLRCLRPGHIQGTLVHSNKKVPAAHIPRFHCQCIHTHFWFRKVNLCFDGFPP